MVPISWYLVHLEWVLRAQLEASPCFVREGWGGLLEET